MRVLVTGGAGYIGSVVVEELLHAGSHVVVYDNLSTGHHEAVHPEAELIIADVADAARLTEVLRTRRIEAIVHMSALIEVGESVSDPARYYEQNVVNSLRLLQAMRDASVGRIVFSSTAAVYGDPDAVPIPEDAPIRPASPYGETKIAVERVLCAFEQAYGLRHAVLRYFNAAGAAGDLGEDREREFHLIPLVLQVALQRRPHVDVFGTDYDTPDGTCIRDYIHVLDLARAHVLALRALDAGSQVYNVGNGSGFSVREVIAAARAVTGHRLPCVEAPRRPGDPARLIASSARIRQDLGWAPRYADLGTIIASAWEWYRRHPNGYSAAHRAATALPVRDYQPVHSGA